MALDATVLRAEGRLEEALEACSQTLEVLTKLPSGISVDVKIAMGQAIEAAYALGRLEELSSCSRASKSSRPGSGRRSWSPTPRGSGRCSRRRAESRTRSSRNS